MTLTPTPDLSLTVGKADPGVVDWAKGGKVLSVVSNESAESAVAVVDSNRFTFPTVGSPLGSSWFKTKRDRVEEGRSNVGVLANNCSIVVCGRELVVDISLRTDDMTVGCIR